MGIATAIVSATLVFILGRGTRCWIFYQGYGPEKRGHDKGDEKASVWVVDNAQPRPGNLV